MLRIYPLLTGPLPRPPQTDFFCRALPYDQHTVVVRRLHMQMSTIYDYSSRTKRGACAWCSVVPRATVTSTVTSTVTCAAVGGSLFVESQPCLFVCHSWSPFPRPCGLFSCSVPVHPRRLEQAACVRFPAVRGGRSAEVLVSRAVHAADGASVGQCVLVLGVLF